MTSGPDRDRMLDAHLRRSLGTGADVPATDACLDAETLAAWMDGGLDAKAVALAENHVSTCGRCQAMVGTMARATPEHAVPAMEPWWRRYRAGWLVPLAAGVAATALWMVVPSERPAAPSMPPQSTEALADAPTVAAVPPSRLPEKAEPAREAPPAAAPVEARKKEQATGTREGQCGHARRGEGCRCPADGRARSPDGGCTCGGPGGRSGGARARRRRAGPWPAGRRTGRDWRDRLAGPFHSLAPRRPTRGAHLGWWRDLGAGLDRGHGAADRGLIADGDGLLARGPRRRRVPHDRRPPVAPRCLPRGGGPCGHPGHRCPHGDRHGRRRAGLQDHRRRRYLGRRLNTGRRLNAD